MELWAGQMEMNPGGKLSGMSNGVSHEASMRFTEWRSKMQSDVLDRGRSPTHDYEDEENYIRRMIKTVLRSHVCYREVDAYAECLVKYKLVADTEIAAKGLVDVNMRLAQEKCPRQISKYVACIDARVNHETVVSAAATHARCDSRRKDFLICLRKWNKSPVLQERNCYHSEYFPLLRCGLNALFDEYWKGVTGYSPAQELHQYEMETDSKVRRGVGEIRQKAEQQIRSTHGNESHLA